MRINPLVQKPSSAPDENVRAALEGYLRDQVREHLYVAMAYVSIAGVRTLLEAFPPDQPTRSHWLVGLDDALTQPGAIQLLLSLKHAQVRVGSFARSNLRFHPKVCRLQTVSGGGKDLLMIGSANLTNNALEGNSEAVVFLETEDAAEKRLFGRVWAELWAQGHVPTSADLKRYTTLYREASKIRRRLPKELAHGRKVTPERPRVILKGDAAELDPAHAQTCWIECGYITAMGRELEFKAEQGLFFGLPPTGGPAKTFVFRTSEGTLVSLRLKYQQNHMWRLQMNNLVPEVRRGLRPLLSDGTLGRSNKVAVFTRDGDPKTFALIFVSIKSRAFKRLETRSRTYGTIGRTSARAYGWC
jgi:hypothetical protein